jgi:predicted dehydrogenase
MSPVSLLVIGAGQRGTGYANWTKASADHEARAKVIGVAEPNDTRRTRFAAQHGIPDANAAKDWRDLAARPKFADAVLICTQDRMHKEPAEAFANLGYHILLEKPMAPTEEECRDIVTAAEKNNVILAVGHVMRYMPYTRALKEVVDSGELGDIMSVQHLEPVGFWHQAHSYVRGNWRRADLANTMLMAKSCHDLDWLQYIVGEPPARVSSFGSLTHFTKENKPRNAADRCVDCAVETECPYSAKRLYTEMLDNGEHHWPLSVLVEDFTPTALDDALNKGPYGTCAYGCDNDVVDHQVVAMEFGAGATATFTMTAFTEMRHRETKIFGTQGELTGDGETIRIYDFLTRTERMITPEQISPERPGAMNVAEGHGGGDAGFMDAFVSAVAADDQNLIHSGPRESLVSHLAVFAAERARVNSTVEPINL